MAEKDQENAGAFVASLKRTNKAIKDDRAEAISEDAEMLFRRRVEDMQMKIKRMKRNRENMLDLSPENSFSLMLADKFDGDKFAEEDIKLGVDIRNEEIKLEIATKRYEYLFGAL
jgi:hypothetical protein